MIHHISGRADCHDAGQCQSVLPCVQGTDPIGKLMGKHGDHPVRQIDACPPFQRLPVQGASLLHIVCHIGNMHAKPVIFSLPDQRNRVIQIFCILAVNGHHLPLP